MLHGQLCIQKLVISKRFDYQPAAAGKGRRKGTHAAMDKGGVQSGEQPAKGEGINRQEGRVPENGMGRLQPLEGPAFHQDQGLAQQFGHAQMVLEQGKGIDQRLAAEGQTKGGRGGRQNRFELSGWRPVLPKRVFEAPKAGSLARELGVIPRNKHLRNRMQPQQRRGIWGVLSSTKQALAQRVLELLETELPGMGF